MKVNLDPNSGFCFGVNRAIQTAEAELDAGNIVYSLGEMVHNQVQMDKLKAKGLQVISLEDLQTLKGKTVLVRAHGEPPSTFRLAEELGITLIDATCPIVTKLQQRIKESSGPDQNNDIQIVIFGKNGHAEVAGLVGHAGNTAIVLNNEEDLTKLDFSKPVRLFSQTTMDAEKYQLIAKAIEHKMSESGNPDLVINKSVCMQVAGRAPSLREFATSNEVIVFVGGHNSANGAYLYSVCKAANSKSYYVSNIENIDIKWFENVSSVGVSGATSTPGWLIEQVATYIQGL